MISPLAYVDSAAKIGKNVTIQPFAFIEGNVEIGDDCIIMSGAKILHGTRMGKGNKVHHNAVLGAEPQDFHYTGENSMLIIGDNNDIRENVVVSRATHAGSATRIGNENYLMDGVHLCHDVQIGNHCVLGIKTTVAGECQIDDCTILSSNVILHQYCHIGSWVLIQAGCRISKDVPPYIIMNGNPAEYHGINAAVLQHKHQVTERVLRHIVNAYRLVYQGNFSVQDALQKIEDQVPVSDEIHNIINFIKAVDQVVPGFASYETLLYSPELKFYSNRVKMDADLNTNIRRLHCLGDSSGWTRGLMMASVMGVLMGRSIADRYEK